MEHFQISIDGPAGAGKTVLGIFLSQKFNFLFIDSGILYRAFVYYCLENKINFTNLKKLKKIIKTFIVDFKNKDTIIINKTKILNLKKLYRNNINTNINAVSNLNFVRKKIVKILKNISKKNNVIMVGRDIGSVVLKKANIKIFLDASLKKRIERRVNQKKLVNSKVNYENIKTNLIKRDTFDINRKHGALKHVKHEMYFDNTQLNVTETNQQILNLLLRKYKFLQVDND